MISFQDIQILGVLGAGQMGNGIAQTAAQARYQVLLADAGLAQAEAGKAKIASALKKQVDDFLHART